MICEMLEGAFFETAGTSEEVPYQEAFIPLIIGAVIAAASAVAGGVAGSKAAKKRQRQAASMLDEKQRKLDAWRDAELGTNYLDRADSRNTLRRMSEYIQDAQKGMNTEAVRRGLTDEAKVAQAAKLNRGYADVVGQLAAEGERHKESVRQQYMAQTSAIDDAKIRNASDTSGAEVLTQGLVGAGSALGSAVAGMGSGTTGGNALTKTAVAARANPDYSTVDSMARSGYGFTNRFLNPSYKITL